jgi:hypothetical protein
MRRRVVMTIRILVMTSRWRIMTIIRILVTTRSLRRRII